ncbi:MAG: hypothetical protein J6M93_06135 [Succinivibrio sp.]|nr:hypothetical protein [Succinivibrio sp.]
MRLLLRLRYDFLDTCTTKRREYSVIFCCTPGAPSRLGGALFYCCA